MSKTGELRLNLLLVSDVSISRVIGGAERVLYEQSIRLARKGHHVHILTRRSPEHATDRQEIQGVTEWRYPVSQGNPVSFLRSSIAGGRALFEKLNRQYPFDCINFHQPFSALGVLQSPESRNIRKVYTCHSLSFEEYRSRNERPRVWIDRALYDLNIVVRKWIEKRALTKAEKVIVLSLFTKDKLLRAYGIPPDKMVIIPGGVDLERFQPSADRGGIRKRLNIPPDRFILLSVRNLVSRMGLDRLVTAMKRVVSILPEVYLLVGGSGPLRDELLGQTQKLGLQDHIRFVGFIPEEVLPDYYRSADLFILPTLELEGFGLVTLEALASGLPVLGTPVGGTMEILSKFDSRYLFKDTEPESMALSITETGRRLIGQPGIWKALSAQCRDFAEEHYSWEKNVDSVEMEFRTRFS